MERSFSFKMNDIKFNQQENNIEMVSYFIKIK